MGEIYLEDLNKQLTEFKDLQSAAIKTNEDFIKSFTQQVDIVSNKQIKSIETLNKGIKESIDLVKQNEQSRKDIAKAQEQNLKLEKRLKEITDKLAKAQEKKTQSNKKESDALAQLAKQRQLAERQVKNLTLKYGENNDKTKQALEVFRELDEEFKKVNKTTKDSQVKTEKITSSYSKLVDVVRKAELQVKDLSVRFGKNSTEVLNARKRYDNLKSILDDVNDTTKTAKERETTLEKTKKKLSQAQTKENKELIKYRKELQDANKQIKAQIAIEKELGIEYEDTTDLLQKLNKEQIKQAETIEEAQKQNSALRSIVRQLNPSIQEQADAISELNDIINLNTEFIKDNSDEQIQNKINVGNYTQSIQEAIGNVKLFNDENGAISGVLQRVSGVVLGFAERAIEPLTDKIGEYIQRQKEATKNNRALRRSFRALGAVGVAIGAVIGTIAAAFGTSQEKALELEIFVEKLKNSFQTFVNVAGSFGQGFLIIFDDIASSLSNIPTQFQIASLKIKKAFLENINSPLKDTTKDVEELEKQIETLQESLDFGSGEDPIDKFNEGIDKFNEGLGASNVILEEQLRLRFRLENQLRIEEIALAKLSSRQSELQRIADSDIVSLKAGIEAGKEASELAEQRAAKELSLARQREKIAEQQIKVELARAGIETSLSANILSNAEARDKVSKESLDALKEANKATIALENELSDEQFEIREKTGKRQLDLFEQNLDFQIDITERNRKLLEDQANNTANSVEKRKASFKSLNDQLNRDLTNQANEFNKLRDALELDIEDITISTTEDGGIQAFVGETELATDNIIELNEQLQELGFSEIPINRLKEVIQDGKDASLEISKLNREFEKLDSIATESIGEALISNQDVLQAEAFSRQIAELLNDSTIGAEEREAKLEEILNQQEQFAKDQEERRINNRIEAIDRELDLVEEGSLDEIQLQIEKNELLARLAEQETEKNKEELEKQISDDKAAEEEKQRLYKQTADFVNKLIDQQIQRSKERSEEEIKNINDQISETQKQRSAFEQAAIEGDATAAKSAAKLKENERELSQEIKKEKRKQQLQEGFFLALKIAAAEVDNPNASGNAVNTVSDIYSGILKFLGSAPAFYEGTETTVADALGYKQGRDSHFSRLDNYESVFTGDYTKAMGIKKGGRTTKDIVNIVQRYDAGIIPNLSNLTAPRVEMSNLSIDNTGQIVQRLDTMTEQFSKLKFSVNLEVNEFKKMAELIVRDGNKFKVNRTSL